ncbi:RTA1 like protein-domain-containing protein [Scheffersomyces amazonensis]|uniref:RTA1 like protein-domain-containing protein n=1 Tax=Scheffersomyces amazonensis TaxID=1078765 RepID=UPI00315C5B29
MLTSVKESTSTSNGFQYYYGGAPSKGVSYNFIVFFTLHLIILNYQIITIACSKKKKAFVTKKQMTRYLCMMIPFCVGCLFETVGFVGRLLSSHDVNNLSAYIMQSTCILLAPTLFAATIYMSFGELVKTLRVDEKSLIKPKYLTKTFVTGDVLSFLLQGSGGGLYASGSSSTGRILILAGLFVQIVFFVLFCIVEIVFYYRVEKHPNNISTVTRQLPSKLRNWRTYSGMLFLVSILILIRSIYRTLEFIQGFDGSIARDQGLLYVLDSGMMNLAAVLVVSFNIPDFMVSFEKQANDFEDMNTIINAYDSKSQDAIGLPLRTLI